MSLDEWVGSAGVFLLLGAFAGNVAGRLPYSSRAYQALNALGAGIACYASWRIGFRPFVVLEGAWTAVALVALVRPRPRDGAASKRATS